MKKEVEKLSLLLLYLSSWDENQKRKYSDKPILKAWKNKRFEVLNKLSEEEFICNSRKSKSIVFTEEGIEKAKKLRKRFLGD